MKKIYISLLFVLMSAVALAQTGSVSGTVLTDEGDTAIGAVVRLDGTSYGAVTDLDGMFIINDVPSGEYDLTISSIGFQSNTQSVVIGSGNTNVGTVSLMGDNLALEGVEIIADIATDRKTPVAVSNISGAEIAEKTGNQDLTAMLQSAPSVYAAQETGGYGDSRLTVRGFDDENVVVMVNGVPVNDMENNALYWSNWTGLQDVASRIQIQRGLGASLLSVPSIGGTVNIISKATDMEKGGWAQVSLGNDMFRKYAVQLSTGNMNGWAMTVAGSRTSGDGYIDGNFIDAYSWFGSITKEWDNHYISLTGFGAPQRHGQGFYRDLNTFVANDGTDYETYLDSKKAHDFDERGALRNNSTGSANSIRYNSGWGYTDYDVNNGFNYKGLYNQYSNFYHKPQVSLSHFWDTSDTFNLNTSIYGSWGRGGGASDWGNLNEFGYQASTATGFGGPIDWDQLISDNTSNNIDGIGDYSDGEDFYFFRASMNHHNYYGVLSKGILELSENLDLTVGIDGRTYQSDHVRKAIDMFGLDGYRHSDFAYAQPNMITVADNSVFGYSDESLFNRNNTANVNWLGGYSEIEYSNDQLTAALGGSVSNKSYKKEQRVEGIEGESDWYNFLGGAVKGGLNYNVNDFFNVYANSGYLSIQPIFDNVFQGGNNGGVSDENIFEDAANEKVFSVEAGAGVRTRAFAANLNLYRTNWQDKAITVSGQDLVSMENIYGNAFGVDALHQGIELDLRVQPVENFDINGAVSIGDWTWENNTEYVLFDQQGNVASEGGLYLEDVKVGNAPQTQFNLSGDYKAPFGLGLYAGYQHNMDFYSGFEAEDRNQEFFSGVNSQKLPDFGLTNAGLNYSFDLSNANTLRFDLNINNLFDKLYINNARESFETFDHDNNPDSDEIVVVDGDGIPVQSPLYDLSGNFGFGRTWNASAKLMFKQTKPEVKVVEVPVPAEPVDLDRDNDGVIDAADDCPDTPGTVKGCPDADGDGFIDSEDDCVDTPGTDNGCPAVETVVEETIINLDSDGDGVVDDKDRCPEVAGNIANYGCPGEVEETVIVRPTIEVVEEMNFIAKSVFFNFDSATLQPESRTKLDEIAAIMNQYPSTVFIIEGHTDSVGSATYNKDLSQRRAQSVVDYLTTKGVSRSNISAVGYGEERPVASNDTDAGRQQNRRVVIKLGN